MRRFSLQLFEQVDTNGSYFDSFCDFGSIIMLRSSVYWIFRRIFDDVYGVFHNLANHIFEWFRCINFESTWSCCMCIHTWSCCMCIHTCNLYGINVTQVCRMLYRSVYFWIILYMHIHTSIHIYTYIYTYLYIHLYILHTSIHITYIYISIHTSMPNRNISGIFHITRSHIDW